MSHELSLKFLCFDGLSADKNKISWNSGSFKCEIQILISSSVLFLSCKYQNLFPTAFQSSLIQSSWLNDSRFHSKYWMTVNFTYQLWNWLIEYYVRISVTNHIFYVVSFFLQVVFVVLIKNIWRIVLVYFY